MGPGAQLGGSWLPGGEGAISGQRVGGRWQSSPLAPSFLVKLEMWVSLRRRGDAGASAGGQQRGGGVKSRQRVGERGCQPRWGLLSGGAEGGRERREG